MKRIITWLTGLTGEINFFIGFSLILFLFLCFTEKSSAQDTAKGNVYVDANGVMRWEDSKEEVYGFGVNYTVPFAHAYRMAEKLNVS